MSTYIKHEINYEHPELEKDIFYAAMKREAKVCEGLPFKEEGESLRWICQCIVNKVERACMK